MTFIASELPKITSSGGKIPIGTNNDELIEVAVAMGNPPSSVPG
jgi:hypothetical protein